MTPVVVDDPSWRPLLMTPVNTAYLNNNKKNFEVKSGWTGFAALLPTKLRNHEQNLRLTEQVGFGKSKFQIVKMNDILMCVHPNNEIFNIYMLKDLNIALANLIRWPYTVCITHIYS